MLTLNPLEEVMECILLLNLEQNYEIMTNTSHTVLLVHIAKMEFLKDRSELWWRKQEQFYSMHMHDGLHPFKQNYGLLQFRHVVNEWNNTPRFHLVYKTPDERFNGPKRQIDAKDYF